MSVPLFDSSTPLAFLHDELRAAVSRVLDSERYILGPEVDAFESEFAAYCGAGEFEPARVPALSARLPMETTRT